MKKTTNDPFLLGTETNDSSHAKKLINRTTKDTSSLLTNKRNSRDSTEEKKTSTTNIGSQTPPRVMVMLTESLQTTSTYSHD